MKTNSLESTGYQKSQYFLSAEKLAQKNLVFFILLDFNHSFVNSLDIHVCLTFLIVV